MFNHTQSLINRSLSINQPGANHVFAREKPLSTSVPTKMVMSRSPSRKLELSRQRVTAAERVRQLKRRRSTCEEPVYQP